MKTVLLISVILISAFGRSQTLELKGYHPRISAGAYVKDTDNFLDQFTGEWKYTSGSDEIVLKLRKVAHYPLGNHFEDVLLGDFKYVKNGSLIVDYLSNFNDDLPNTYNHSLFGNTPLTKRQGAICYNCPDDSELFVVLIIQQQDFAPCALFCRVILEEDGLMIDAASVGDGIHYGVDGDGNTVTLGLQELTLPNAHYQFLKQP